jgi:CRISPR-associated exonuclease Cas4
VNVLPIPAPREDAFPTLAVSDLRQWTYCPRVTWWSHVQPVGKILSVKMHHGLLKERRLQRLQKRRSLAAFGLADGTFEANVSLHSPRLGLTGRLDLLLRHGAARYPVEIKFTHGPTRLNHRLQLAGYALLLEDVYSVPVPHGYVVRLPDDTVDRVLVDAPLRDLATKTLAALRRMIREERIPPASTVPARCTDCEYRNFCGDVP